MADIPRMRILLVTRNLPPLTGGMERLNWHMAAELSKTHEVKIIGPQGSAAIAPQAVGVHEVPLKPVGKFLLASWYQAHRMARQWQPDIVLAGSGLTGPIAYHTARACKAKTVVYVHGLDIAVKHPIYRLLWLPSIRKADRIITNSEPTRELCLEIGIKQDRIGTVHPGVELPSKLDSSQRTRFRSRNGFGERPLLLSVGRLSARKGLREFVRLSLPHIVKERPETLLLIVGDVPDNALNSQAQTPDSILAEAEKAGISECVRFLGKVDDKELSSLYQAADVHIFPVRTIPGDPEGFGMVAVEAAAHGLPTVAFATGGIVDAISEGKSGHLITPCDYVGMAETILHVLTDSTRLRQSCRDFASRFSWPVFGEQLGDQIALLSNRRNTQ